MIVADGPELVAIYLQGAKSERLLADVFCGLCSNAYGAKVRVPSALYGVQTHRLLDVLIDSVLHYFLAERAMKAFYAPSSRRAPKFGRDFFACRNRACRSLKRSLAVRSPSSSKSGSSAVPTRA